MSASVVSAAVGLPDQDAVLWAVVQTGGTQDGQPYGMFLMNEADARRQAANVGAYTPEGDEGWYALIKVSVPRSQLRRFTGTLKRVVK